jgi:succinate dehydrogenase / fumarate reductase cytochrome b subunit
MSDATASAGTRTRAITEKQIMSILGVVPLGAYVVAHLWTNLYSLGGADLFNQRLTESRSSPAFIFLEVFGLGVPILVHAWIGLKLIVKGRPNVKNYPTLRNLKYGLQRLAGVGVLLFLGAHVLKARILPATSGVEPGHETWAGMHEALSEPITFTVYLLGLLGVSYHLANGLWGSAMTLGLTVTPKAQARMEWVTAVVFVVLLAMSGLALYGFRPFSQV